MKLDIGAGDVRMDGWVSLDISGKPAVIADLEYGLPFVSGSLDKINAKHVLEHIKGLIPLMAECHRVLKPGGKMFIEVPCAWDPELAWRDPGHVRAFVPDTFAYWEEGRRGGYLPHWRVGRVMIYSESGHLLLRVVFTRPYPPLANTKPKRRKLTKQ